MSDSPCISILINNYNYGRFLDTCILSALNQDYENFEIIVVDDGSKDNSKEVLEKYLDRVTVILKSNCGQASAFNAGFDVSRGEIICFLDADDAFYPYKISEVVNTFINNPEIKWIFHELDYVNKEGTPFLVSRVRSLPMAIFVDAVDSMRQGIAPQEFIPCGLCFKREILEEILPMPESSGVSISDNYLKYAAIGLSPGLLLNKRLATQRIHDDNTYTFRSGNHRLHAEIHVKTGFYLQERFPKIGLFADRLFVKGVAEMLINFDFKSLSQMPEVKKHILRNLKFKFIFVNSLKLVYHCFRFSFLKSKYFFAQKISFHKN